jgi:hypothetical protein
MLVLGILDELCTTPSEAMVSTTMVRVRKKIEVGNDYF